MESSRSSSSSPAALPALSALSRQSSSAPNFLYFSAFVACLASLSNGMCIGFTSPAFPKMRQEGITTDDENSWFAALLPLAAMAGALSAGWLVDVAGRRRCILATSLPFVLGWVMVAGSARAADSAIDAETGKLVLLYLGRILTGWATGAGTICVPTYLAEIAPKNKRGRIGSLNQLFITLGVELVYLLGYALSSWEWLAIFSAVPATFTGILMLFCPESPRWLIAQNRDSDALEVLSRIRHGRWDILEEAKETREALNDNSVQMAPMWRRFGRREVWLPLLVSLGLMVFQQFSGINVFIFNSNDIFAASGFSDSGAAMCILGAVNFVATVLSVAVIDRWGRRALLNFGGVGMIVALVVAGVADYLTANLSVLSLVSLLVFIVSFAIGFGPIPWLMMSEVFPNQWRGFASAVASVVNWVCCFVVTKTYQNLKSSIHSYGVYWFYACWTLVGFIFTLTLVPETKNVSLEEIERNFQRGSIFQIDCAVVKRNRRRADYDPIA